MTTTKKCATCGEIFSRLPRRGDAKWVAQRFCSRACVRRPQHPLGPNTRYRRRGKRQEHRVVMEAVLGRPLMLTEQVHHKNAIRTDNRPENLVVMATIEHQRHHKLKHPLEKQCAICTRVFTPHKTKRRRQLTCSWACRNALIAVNRHGISLEEAQRRVAPEVAEALVRANLPRAARRAA